MVPEFICIPVFDVISDDHLSHLMEKGVLTEDGIVKERFIESSASDTKAAELAQLPSASFKSMRLNDVKFMFENSSDVCVEWRQGVLKDFAIPEGFGEDQTVTDQYLNDPNKLYLNDLAQDYKRLTPELYIEFLGSKSFVMTALFLDPEKARQANNPSLATVIEAAKSAFNEIRAQK